MLWWIYELVFWAALAMVSPYYLLRMKRRGGYARDFMERFGIFEQTKLKNLRGMRPVWIHAVSVGEVNLALQLIQKLLERSNPPSLVLSTTTSTGHALAARKLPPHVPLFYYPLDSRFCFGRIHNFLLPHAFILIEAELWPNHLRFCGEKKIPVMLINARFSKRFYPRYRKFQWLFAPAFHAFRRVTLQSQDDYERLQLLGFLPETLLVVGNLKYDTATGIDVERRSRLLSDLSLFGERPIWVAGSTHSGEEKIVLDIFMRLRLKHPGLLLGLAPRHAERAAEISSLIKRYDVPHILRSELSAGINFSPTKTAVLLLNTTGELKYLYERATVIFIGKSLVEHGGQNIIEPAVYGKPVLFGPHMENFEGIVQDFLKAAAAIQVQNASELEAKIEFLLDHPDHRKTMGKRASDLVRSKQGGMQRTLTAIHQLLSETHDG